jgi:hypothetical protein
MPLSAPVASHRGRVAALARAVRNGERSPEDPELNNARQDLAYERLAEQAAKVVADWPTPPPEVLNRIAAILRSGGAV